MGSEPYQASPTSASAIALRIAGEGLVTVSERRSTRKGTMRASLARGPPKAQYRNIGLPSTWRIFGR